MLFNDTISYNIAYGNPTVTHEQVIEAAKLARIHDTILQFPEGYETKVGERGLKLSGGEKQRVAIARMILKEPKIIFCDEATSSLDTKTEREILEMLKGIAKEKTAIFIAHRLSTIQDVDVIFVIGNGKIIESGSHMALLKNKSTYYEMWNAQTRTGEI